MKESEVERLELNIKIFYHFIERGTRSVNLSKQNLLNEGKSIEGDILIVAEMKIIESFYKSIRLAKERLISISKPTS